MGKKEEKGNEKKGKKERPEGILIIRGDEEKAEKSVREGGIDATFFIESHGPDRETVAEALKNTLIKDLRNERGVVVRDMKFHPVVEKEKIYSGFVECNFVARDFQTLLYLALRYGPSAVEILQPDRITLERAEMQGTVADVSAAVQALVGKILELMAPEERTKVLRKGLGLDEGEKGE